MVHNILSCIAHVFGYTVPPGVSDFAMTCFWRRAPSTVEKAEKIAKAKIAVRQNIASANGRLPMLRDLPFVEEKKTHLSSISDHRRNQNEEDFTFCFPK